MSRPVRYVDLTRSVGPLEFTHIAVATFGDRAKLIEVLERNNPGRRIRVPRIDFTNHVAYLVAAGPRSSTGYALEIVRVRDEGDRVLVVVHERTPSVGEPVRARVTYPFRLIVLPRLDKPVKLKWPGRP
jgi:protease stability complex PrcB-like protein